MKAIQIKVIPATATKDVRLKAWSDAGVIIEPRKYDNEINIQAGRLAIRYWEEMKWNENTRISGFGTLPNGDYVATLMSTVKA